MIKKIIISINLVILLTASSYYFLTTSSAKSKNLLIIEGENGVKNHNLEINNSLHWPPEIQNIIDQLISKYADTIQQTHIQAQLIYIREPLLSELPLPKKESLTQVLTTAFPNEVDSILLTWSKMDRYEEWLLVQNRTLLEMNTLSRSGFLWQKRNELFPLAAHDIWTEEQDNYEIAQLNLYSEIELLDKSLDLNMSEKVLRLERSFSQANNLSSISGNENISIHKTTIASVLFGMASVQTELQQLDPRSRQLEINKIRRELGFDEQSLIKMSVQDAKREERWSNGYAYMQSREELLADNDQVEPEKLNNLREQFFGNSSATIAREEEQGFYRFQRPRYYGRN